MLSRQRPLLLTGLVLLALAAVLWPILLNQLNHRAAYVHVRWAPSVDRDTREQLEIAHGLRRPQARPSRTWSYYVTDLSPSNFERLVHDPAVEDTNFIDRQWFTLDPTATRVFKTQDDAQAAEVLALALRLTLFAGLATTGLALSRMFIDGSLHIDVAFALILVAALIPRLYLAATAPYIHDEENTAIPLSRSISFARGAVHLPLRGENHGALPAYVVKASSSLFGQTPLGYRGLHVILGLCTILLVYRLTKLAYGEVAARWAASLMAFNEYFLSFSSRATANTPYLFLTAAAIYCFARFLTSERRGYLYGATAAAGLAFYCKEHAALLLPLAGVVLLWPDYRKWLRRPAVYGAAALFALLISPDVVWNMRTDPNTAHVEYSGQYLGQATYSAHLKRVGGLGLSEYPAMFYARGPVTRLHDLVTGKPLGDVTREYHSMNPALGLLLVAAMLWFTVSPSGPPPLRRWLLFVSWGIFLFFTFITPGNTPYRLTPVSWVWVEVTLVPAVVFGGALLARVQGRLRTILWVATAATLLYAIDALTMIGTGGPS